MQPVPRAATSPEQSSPRSTGLERSASAAADAALESRWLVVRGLAESLGVAVAVLVAHGACRDRVAAAS